MVTRSLSSDLANKTPPLKWALTVWTFSIEVLKAFRANQGLLLAGAVAYYTLLSLVPLLILVLIGLLHFIDQQLLFSTLTEYLGFLVPGQADAVVEQLRL